MKNRFMKHQGASTRADVAFHDQNGKIIARGALNIDTLRGTVESAKTEDLIPLLRPRRPGQLATAILGKGVTVQMDSDGNYVLPPSAAECADLLYRSRERRLEMQRETEKIAKLESQISNWFVETLPAGQTGVAGRVARVQVETKAVAQVADWDRLYAYVKKNNAWELLQRRLSEGAAKERLDAGQGDKAGLTVFLAKKVSCTRI